MSTAESGMWFPSSPATAKSAAHAQDKQKWDCPSCHKTSYVDEYRAWQAIGTISRKNFAEGDPNRVRPCRVYACPEGEGYHLTSKWEDWSE